MIRLSISSLNLKLNFMRKFQFNPDLKWLAESWHFYQYFIIFFLVSKQIVDLFFYD